MAVYKGTIAGIGDKYLGANLIKPEFDAKIYKFIISKDCIIDGLDLNDNILTAGMCVAQGYRGELKSPLTLDTTAYVYGVFKVNFDSDSLDEFYIETSTTEIIRQDDILHTAGTYYLLLYKNGAAQLSHNYPQNAVYADNTDHINDNGTLGKNVTAPTQSVDENSTKVATTAFVKNQIEKEINAVTLTDSINAVQTSTRYPSEVSTHIFAKKRAQIFVIDKILFTGKRLQGTDRTFIYVEENTILASVPLNCAPQEELNIGKIGTYPVYINQEGKIFTKASGIVLDHVSDYVKHDIPSTIKNVGYTLKSI